MSSAVQGSYSTVQREHLSFLLVGTLDAVEEFMSNHLRRRPPADLFAELLCRGRLRTTSALAQAHHDQPPHMHGHDGRQREDLRTLHGYDLREPRARQELLNGGPASFVNRTCNGDTKMTEVTETLTSSRVSNRLQLGCAWNCVLSRCHQRISVPGGGAGRHHGSDEGSRFF